ncbi:MAG: HAD-IC family P-type ATPase, partial [Ruminiclostridium sp.]
IADVYAELLPEDKSEITQREKSEITDKGKVMFVGDGINDAPVIASADIGVAMGGAGADSAIETADCVLMYDDPMQLADAFIISKKTNRIVKQNIVFALGVKLIVQVLGVLGIASMWAAVFADVGVSIIAILNSLRLMKK